MSRMGLILIGGGGHCKSCIDVIVSEDRYEIIGILDRSEKLGTTVSRVKVIDIDENALNYISKEICFLITIGYYKQNTLLRSQIFNRIKSAGGSFATIVSPFTHIAKDAVIDEGSIIMHGSVIGSDATIKQNCIISHQTVIDHDAIINGHSILMHGTIIGGGAIVPENSYLDYKSVLARGTTFS